METRTLIIIALVIALALVTTGCSSIETATAAVSLGDSDLPTAVEMAAGTLALEGTAQAVTASQASQLAYLWSAYETLSQSDSTAASELTALLSQISAAMTAEQVAAIEDLNLDDAAVQALIADQGIVVGAASSDTASDSSSAVSAAPMGGGDGGGMPAMDGGGQAPSDGGMMTEGIGQTSASSSTDSSAGQASDALLSSLIEALVTVLQARAS